MNSDIIQLLKRICIFIRSLRYTDDRYRGLHRTELGRIKPQLFKTA